MENTAERCKHVYRGLDLRTGDELWTPCGHRYCAICRANMAIRRARQIEYERARLGASCRYAHVRKEDWKQWATMLRGARVPYIRFPAAGGLLLIMVVSDSPCFHAWDIFDGDRDFMAGELDAAIERAAFGPNITSSRGLGGPFAGAREPDDIIERQMRAWSEQKIAKRRVSTIDVSPWFKPRAAAEDGGQE